MVLEKWYGDVVDGDSVQIRYLANLRLGPLALGYEGKIGVGGRSTAAFSIGPVELPREVDGALLWPIGADARPLAWSGPQNRPRELWRQGGRVALWDPKVLNGVVRGPGLSAGASGYAERLTINCTPGHLGIRVLKWGRFCGRRHSVVWIEWCGAYPQRLALIDGRAGALVEVAGRQVLFEGAELLLLSPRVLVDAPLMEGALKGLPLANRLRGLRVLSGVEKKWYSAAQLLLRDEVPDQGHAVFEEVVWP